MRWRNTKSVYVGRYEKLASYLQIQVRKFYLQNHPLFFVLCTTFGFILITVFFPDNRTEYISSPRGKNVDFF